jgi:hypothetical protein
LPDVSDVMSGKRKNKRKEEELALDEPFPTLRLRMFIQN